jgi:hypothetical protein
MISRMCDRERGSALVMSLLTSFMLFGIAGSYLIVSYGGWETSNRELATIQARLDAEDGVQLSIAEIKTGIDGDGNGVGNITTTVQGGATVNVTATSLGLNLFRLHSVGVLDRARHGAEVVAQRIPSDPLTFTARAAVTANGPVTTLGNITIDGRDWNLSGTSVVGAGRFGISTTSTVVNSGNSKVGGNGIAPAKPPPAGTQQSNANWNDGINQDGDGATDEEVWDGIDNDGDGVVDEDTHGYPTGPDAEFKLPEGTLKATAIASGTYFTSAASYNACVMANGGQVPGGKIIYLDFPMWDPCQFGSIFNSPPSIIVQHQSGGTAVAKNVHGLFSGLVLADGIEHLNGDFVILGALMSFAPQSYGNAFGNGNAFVKLCTAALANLPSASAASKVRITSWHRAVAQ